MSISLLHLARKLIVVGRCVASTDRVYGCIFITCLGGSCLVFRLGMSLVVVLGVGFLVCVLILKETLLWDASITVLSMKRGSFSSFDTLLA